MTSQLHITEVHEIATAVERIFFSTARETCSRLDHTLGHETSVSALTRVGVVQSMFSNCKGMSLENNNKRKFKKFTNM